MRSQQFVAPPSRGGIVSFDAEFPFSLATRESRRPVWQSASEHFGRVNESSSQASEPDTRFRKVPD